MTRESKDEALNTAEPMTVIARTKSSLAAIIRTDVNTPEDIAKLKAKTQLKQFLAGESGSIKDSDIVYQILQPGDKANIHDDDAPRHVSQIDFHGQLIELNPKKMYIVAMNSNSVQPEQAYYLREQLREAGIRAGVLLATPSDQPVMFLDEHPLELGDDDRQQQRINAREALAEAQNNLQQAARQFISAHAQIIEQLELQQSEKQAEAFSELFVAIEKSYDAAEDPINADQMAQQKGLES